MESADRHGFRKTHRRSDTISHCMKIRNRMFGYTVKQVTGSRPCKGQVVRQGCILSPYLFNLMAELLMRMALDGYEGGFRIGGWCITNLRYADDILIASSEEELRDMVNRLHVAATKTGMKINAKKTELMKVSDDPRPVTVTVAGSTRTETKSFKYPGAQFNSEASCDEEVKAQLAIARHRMSELTPIW